MIAKVNGNEVKDARDLAKRIASMAPGTSVKLDVLRKGSEKSVTVTLGELPTQQEARASADEQDDSGNRVGRLGLTVAPADRVAGSNAEGLVVTNVDPSGIAADHGFKTGDVILEVAGKSVTSPADMRKAIADARSGGKRSVLMRVKSGESTRFVAVPVGRA